MLAQLEGPRVRQHAAGVGQQGERASNQSTGQFESHVHEHEAQRDSQGTRARVSTMRVALGRVIRRHDDVHSARRAQPDWSCVQSNCLRDAVRDDARK